MSLPDEVRAHAAQVVATARWVRIDADALERYAQVSAVPTATLDPERHYLDGHERDVAAYLLTLDTINFGSGWFPTLTKRRDAAGRPVSGYNTVAWALADRFRAQGPWSADALRAMRTEEIAAVLGQPADHELMALYAQALRQLGWFLGTRSVTDVIAGADGSAVTLAGQLARGMGMFHDPGFFKRAQIAPSNLALAGLATWTDLDRLTIFADNLVPHVLRCDGVLVYEDRLAEHIDAERPLRPGAAEREIRASAVHACAALAARLSVTEPELDAWLWNRGQAPDYKARPRHRCRCVSY